MKVKLGIDSVKRDSPWQLRRVAETVDEKACELEVLSPKLT